MADAVRAGIPRARLRGKDLVAPFHGLRVRAGEAAAFGVDRRGREFGSHERDHLDRASAFAVSMDGDLFFSHLTAAIIWGVPLPPALVRSAPVHVGVLAPHRLPRGRGVRGHQLRPHSTCLVHDEFTQWRVTSAATTWATLAAVLKDPADLIAAGDAFVRTWRVDAPLATTAQLEAAVRAGRRVGVAALRAALPDLRTRSASRPETRVRLELMWSGLPEPHLNHDVRDRGRHVACVDLAYPGLRIAMEYEGEHHLLDPDQWAYDIRRYEELARLGWTVIRITKSDLFDRPRELVARVRRAIAARV